MRPLKDSAFASEVQRAAQALDLRPSKTRAQESSIITNSALGDSQLLALTAAIQQLQAIHKTETGPSQGEESDDTAITTNPAATEYVYDSTCMKFYKLMPSGHWVALGRSDVANHLALAGHAKYTGKNEALSETDKIIVNIQTNHWVNFAGQLAGYRMGVVSSGGSRILVTSEATFIEPKAGCWTMLKGILERMFGDQIEFVYGWIKIALQMFSTKVWMAGQVLVLCGEPQSGKNLFATILQHLFGGRQPGKPYDFMTDRTNFNSDYMGCELLTIEDEASTTSNAARRAFGARLKQLAVNETQKLHRKHAEALTVVPLQRLLISLNNEPERLLVLPPLEPDIEDKIMLLLVHKHPMPMQTSTPQQRSAFTEALVRELSAFVSFLESWEIPEHLACPRFGIRHHHHQDLREALQVQAPEAELLHLVDEIIFVIGRPLEVWRGTANELLRELRETKDQHLQKEITGLLHNSHGCAKYLCRLASKSPDRVTMRPGGGGINHYVIHAPSYEPKPEELEVAAEERRAAAVRLEEEAKREILRRKVRKYQALNSQTSSAKS